jgi:hypothetical protein
MDEKGKGLRGNGEFFAIDRRVWAHVCNLGLNAAVAYLVMARGSGRDNRTTAWSVNAIEKYTGIGRLRAKMAIQILEKKGIIRGDHTNQTKPRYFLTPAHEVPGCEGYPSPLDPNERQVWEYLSSGNICLPDKSSPKWGYCNPSSVAKGLVKKGRVRDLGGGNFEPDARWAETASQSDWIWLPNTIIDGAAAETAPVELLRQSQNVAALRLFVDLYHAHNLASDGGIHWQGIRQEYVRNKVREHGAFIIWGFQVGNDNVFLDAPFVKPCLTGKYERVEGENGPRQRDSGVPVFWAAESLLKELGLFEFVGHVVEADTAEGEPIHPYAVGNGEEIERKLALAAQRAAEAMLTEEERNWARDRGLLLVPVQRHLSAVQMIGVARLRYRPRTKATAAWFAERQGLSGWVSRYEAMAAPRRMQHQR